MTEINKDELKRIQIGILDKVTTFCEENNIRYSLYGGTLLGAIRHKGYIPWDDDIDISMPRPDYERFLKTFHETENSYLKIHDLRLNKKYPYPFIKVSDERTLFIENCNNNYEIGVNIDIFPIDGLPSSCKKSVRIFKKSNFYRNLLELKRIIIIKERAIHKNVFIILARILLLLVPIRYLLNKIIRLATKNDYEESDYIGNIVWGYASKERCSKSVYNDYITKDFEGRKYKIMAGYEEYLTNVFGDYMQLPPKEQQESHHSFNAYLISN